MWKVFHINILKACAYLNLISRPFCKFPLSVYAHISQPGSQAPALLSKAKSPEGILRVSLCLEDLLLRWLTTWLLVKALSSSLATVRRFQIVATWCLYRPATDKYFQGPNLLGMSNNSVFILNIISCEALFQISSPPRVARCSKLKYRTIFGTYLYCNSIHCLFEIQKFNWMSCSPASSSSSSSS